MFKGNAPSIADWFPILKWKKLPNFGNCHSCATSTDFQDNYFIHEEIETLYSNIVISLSNGVNAQNIRISGEPGAGKTSFLYAFEHMCKNAEEGSALNNYVIHIIHINQTYDSGNTFYEEEANRHIIEAWKKYYESCAQGDTFYQLNQNTEIKSQKELLNALSDHYKSNKVKFNKTLIVAVDDVDLLNGKEVKHAVEHLLKSIEINSVKKWLSIRRMTLENYSGETKKKIEEFFPDPYEFPTIPLDDLLLHRITKTCGNTKDAINPFSKVICNDIISPICDNNLRESLGLAKTLLEENLPKKMPHHTDEAFISNFLQTASVKSLCTSQKLVDLHSAQYRLTSFPFAIDILGCLEYHTDENIIFGSVNDCCNKRNELCHYPIGSKEKIHKLRTVDFNDITTLLESHGLLKKSKKRLFITPRGKVTISFATRDYYLSYFENIHKISIENSVYWSLASKKLKYKELVELLITWREKRYS